MLSRTKLAALVILAVCAVSLLLVPQHNAQPREVEGGQLQAKSETALKAMLSGTDVELYNAFAPWIRGSADWMQEVWVDSLKDEAKRAAKDEASKARHEAKQVKWVHKHDPADRYKIRTLDDMLALKPHQLLAIGCGQLRLQGNDKVKERREAKWHFVNRTVYQAVEPAGKNRTRARTFGEVSFANRFEDVLVVQCVAETGNDWYVVDIAGKVGEEAVKCEVMSPAGDAQAASARDAKRAEGEQMLGSFKNQARVAYAKMGSAPSSLTGKVENGGCNMNARELVGQYCRGRDEVWSTAKQGAIACEGTEGNEGIGYCLLIFTWAGGDGTFTWYDTQEELEADIKKFEKG
ncbi:MAG: hypothetical protein IT464_15805 [Planctomycetes bacterium]|nr:hypothetical protein [Planctomycetota bacterium]